jgi:hypothetical protein
LEDVVFREQSGAFFSLFVSAVYLSGFEMVDDSVDMKAKIEKVLKETGNTENRAAKMDVDDLLK